MLRKISARKVEIKALDVASALDFLEIFHRSGAVRTNANSRAFGLLFEDELLGVALFGSPRTSAMQRRYRFELQRMAFKNDVRVQGGASKLIAAFKAIEPTDFFTYQDTAGEATAVYEHAGMKLLGSANPRKKVLVRNGLTKTSAENNRKDWFSLEQAVRFGPDNLLGTALGEVYESGKRLSNVELFLKYCDYHLEDIPGDRLYEWRNPNVLFYTYRITSLERPGYYIGRHGLRGKNLTIDDCLSDGYMGSGGDKFKNWVNLVDASSLRKEVLGIYSTWEEVVSAEIALIGESYRDDPLCKNLRPGGVGSGYSGISPIISMGECEIHGYVKFSKDRCCTCTATKSIGFSICSVHGVSLHRGKTCLSCAKKTGYSIKECATHGITTFSRKGCWQCSQESSWTQKSCPEHGVTTFHGTKCVKCSASKSVQIRNCSIHGPTLHQGKACRKCSGERSVSIKNCSTHGESLHRGNTCYSCMNQENVVYGECPTHGRVRYQKGFCVKCKAGESITQQECGTHGLTNHRNGICYRCNAEKSSKIDYCSIHGETKFRGSICQKCKAAKTIRAPYKNNVMVRNCSTHGETKHIGETCSKCSISKRESSRECQIHGRTKFQGNNCAKCNSEKLVKLKVCEIHGETKHRGKSCYQCMGDRRKLAKANKQLQ